MNCLKNNNGISIVMLVITIILMILLTAMAIFYSQNITSEAHLASALTSLQDIKNVCEQAIIDIESNPDLYDEFFFFGYNIKTEKASELDDYAHRCGLIDGTFFSDRTYLITDDGTVDSRRRLNALEISSIDDTFVVDLDNKKYYLVDGIKRADNSIVYELSEIRRLYDVITRTEKAH